MATTRTIVIPSIPRCIGKMPTIVNQRNVICAKSQETVIFPNSSPLTCISTLEKITHVPSANMSLEEKRSSNRKRRLDHLTLEEKLQRKKLKNRVAAQTSRDRKKAKMDELEAEVKQLREKNHQLAAHCERLLSEKQQLSEENAELRSRQCSCQTGRVSSRPAVSGSAESTFPLPQGQCLLLAPGLTTMHYLLYWLRLLMMTVCLSWKNLPTAYLEKLTLIWKERALNWARLKYVEKIPLFLKWWGKHQKTWKPVEDYQAVCL